MSCLYFLISLRSFPASALISGSSVRLASFFDLLFDPLDRRQRRPGRIGGVHSAEPGAAPGLAELTRRRTELAPQTVEFAYRRRSSRSAGIRLSSPVVK